MKKGLQFLNRYLEEILCVALMSVMTIIIFVQVIMRYVAHNSCHGQRSWPDTALSG